MAPTPDRIIIGVDPGGRDTGIAVIDGRRQLVAASVITRHPDNTIDDHVHGLAAWVDQVLAAINAQVAAILDAAAGDIVTGWLPADTFVAVETFRRPSPHKNRANGNALINVDGLLATAAIVGAVEARYNTTARLLLVPPANNGSNVAAAYPAPIRQKPGAAGQDRNRHARSAYDVALTGAYLAASGASSARFYADEWPAKTTTATVHR